MKRLQNATIQLIYDLHEEDLTPREIAQELGISVASVYRYLQEMQFTPNNSRKLSSDLVSTVLNEYYNNVPIKTLCQRYYISISQLYTFIYRNNMLPRTVVNAAKVAQRERLRHAVYLYTSTSLPVEKIAIEVNLSKPTIYRYLKQNNIKMRKSK